MNVMMTVFAFIGVMCCALVAVTLVAIAWYNIQEKREKKKDEM